MDKLADHRVQQKVRHCIHATSEEVSTMHMKKSAFILLIIMSLGVTELHAQDIPPSLARMQQLIQTTELQQRQPAIQQELTNWFLSRVQAYRDILRPYAAGNLVTLGTWADMRASMAMHGGNADWIVLWRNRDGGGPTKNPGEPFIFPTDGNPMDLLQPLSIAAESTCWHEMMHGFMAQYTLSAPGLFGADQEHVYIENYVQYTMEWLYALNHAGHFEELAREAQAETEAYRNKNVDITFEIERQLWGRVHQAWQSQWPLAQRIAALDEELRIECRTLFNIQMPRVEEVLQFYMNGGLRTTAHALVRIPAWVMYPDIPLAVAGFERDASRDEQEYKGGVLKYKTTFSVVGFTRSPEGRARRDRIARGTLIVRLESSDDSASISLRAGQRILDGIMGPGGPSNRLFKVDLSAIPGEIFHLVIAHRRPSEIRNTATYRISLEFSDTGTPLVFASSKAILWLDLKAPPAAPGASTTSPTGSNSGTPVPPQGGGLAGIWRGTGTGGMVNRGTSTQRMYPGKVSQETESIRTLPVMAYAVRIDRAADDTYTVQLRPDLNFLIRCTKPARGYSRLNPDIKEPGTRTDYEGSGPQGFYISILHFKNSREWLEITAHNSQPSGDAAKDFEITQYTRYQALELMREKTGTAQKSDPAQKPAPENPPEARMRIEAQTPVATPPALDNKVPEVGTLKPVSIRKVTKSDTQRKSMPKTSQVTGVWDLPEDPEDCISLEQTGDEVHGMAYYKGRPLSELTGYSRNGSLVLAMRRLYQPDIGAWIFMKDGENRLKGQSLNPDGSLRWNGRYVPSSKIVPATQASSNPVQASSQNLAGTWVATGDPEDYIVLSQSDDKVRGDVFFKGRKIAELKGFQRISGTVLAMRRLDTQDIGVWIFILDSRGRLSGKSLNPDGGIRWRGSYERKQ